MLDAVTPLDSYRALELNGDGRPLSVQPLSTLSWREAIEGVIADKYAVLAEYDAYARSPSIRMRLPSVVMSRRYVDITGRTASWTRWNVFLAYRFRCAYCNQRFSSKELTFDHVIPRSRGGVGGWDNIVPACVRCNSLKANRTPQEARMPMAIKPYRPTQAKLNALAMAFLRERADLHKDWLDFLYWDEDLIE